MSPSSRQWSLLIALAAVFSIGVSQSWSEDECSNKYQECRNLYFTNVQTCAHYNQTIHCLGTYRDHCIGDSLSVVFLRNTTIKERYCPGDCYPVEGATQQECENSFFPPPPNQTPPPPANCSYSPPLNIPESPSNPPITPLGSLSLSPSLNTTPECTLPNHNTYYRQHCSIFSLSHLRTFSDRDLPLQTCVILGEVYLIKHESLSIAVNGAFREGNAGQVYTYITEVNVTLQSHSCFTEPVSYFASVDVGLPDNVAGLDDQHFRVSNGSVATILAPWINTSIVIHRTQGYLSVTLQVPEPLTREGEVGGLCSKGCPAGFEVAPTDVEFPEYECMENKEDVLVMCLSLGLATPPVSSMLYSVLCAYDILLTHDLSFLSLYHALNKAALALPDVTEVVTTLPTDLIPTLPTDLTLTPPSETMPTTPKVVVTSIIIISTTDASGLASRAPPSTPPLSPLVTLLFGLATALLLLLR